jgi:hypothetical protein
MPTAPGSWARAGRSTLVATTAADANAGLGCSEPRGDAYATPNRPSLVFPACLSPSRHAGRNPRSYAGSGPPRRHPFSAVPSRTRPVKPEVAGSSPVAPVEKTPQFGILLSVLAQSAVGFPTGHALIPHANPDAVPVSVKPCKSPCSAAGHGVRVLGHAAVIPQANRPAALGGAVYEWPEASCSSSWCGVAAVSA